LAAGQIIRERPKRFLGDCCGMQTVVKACVSSANPLSQISMWNRMHVPNSRSKIGSISIIKYLVAQNKYTGF
jgi:hypothetical protein